MDQSRLGRLPPPFSFQPMQPLQVEHDHQQQQHHHQHHQGGPSLHNSEEDEYSNSSGQNVNSVVSKGNGNTRIRSKGPKLLAGSEGEVVRKPRGRPPGSKNKPKPPIIITRETGTGMRPHVLEIASGCDVHECIATFARRRQRSICVLGASGTVSNVTLRQATVPPGPGGGGGGSSGGSAVLTLHGRFDILSMSGTFMQPPPAPQPLMPMPLPPSPSLFPGGPPGNHHPSSPPSMPTCPNSGLSISLASAQGQVIGGIVVGALMSVSPILVIAASFLGPCMERLPLDDHEVEHALLNGNNGGGPGGPFPPHHLALTPGGSSGGPVPGIGIGGGGGGNSANDPCAMSLYNLPQVSLGNQMPDILAWAAAAGGRPPF